VPPEFAPETIHVGVQQSSGSGEAMAHALPPTHNRRDPLLSVREVHRFPLGGSDLASIPRKTVLGDVIRLRIRLIHQSRVSRASGVRCPPAEAAQVELLAEPAHYLTSLLEAGVDPALAARRRYPRMYSRKYLRLSSTVLCTQSLCQYGSPAARHRRRLARFHNVLAMRECRAQNFRSGGVMGRQPQCEHIPLSIQVSKAPSTIGFAQRPDQSEVVTWLSNEDS